MPCCHHVTALFLIDYYVISLIKYGSLQETYKYKENREKERKLKYFYAINTESCYFSAITYD